MKISFLVTYYNQVHFVKQSLESILALDILCEYEILVGDDGSNDGTVDEIRKIIKTNPNIKLFIMDRDPAIKYNPILRASENRLNLLKHARGEYYCFLDGDDWYTSKTFAKEAIHIMDSDNNISVCAFNFVWVSDDDIKLQYVSLPEGKSSGKKYLLTTYIHVAACVFRNILGKKKLELIKDTKYFDDQDITIAHLDYGDIYYIPKVSFAYRQTGLSIWTSMTSYEKYILDAFHYDIMIRYSDKHAESIRKRYFSTLKFIWEERGKIYEELGIEKAEEYISSSRRINGLFYRIINFDELSNAEKLFIKNIFKESTGQLLITYLQFICLFIKKIFIFFLPHGIVRFMQLIKQHSNKNKI